MKVEVVQDARRKWNIKKRFSEPTLLLSIDGGLAVYIYVYESKRVCSWTARRDNPPYLRCKWAPSCCLK